MHARSALWHCLIFPHQDAQHFPIQRFENRAFLIWHLGNAPSNLLDSILNDDVLYDFVSFLIEEAQSKGPHSYDQDSKRRFSESYGNYPESREHGELVQMVSSDDTSQFLKDGFTPIIEVVLDK